MARASNWTDREDELIRELYGTVDIQEICGRIFRETGMVRHAYAVRARASQLGLTNTGRRGGAIGRRHPWNRGV